MPASGGRLLSGTGFDNDTGEADPTLAAALAHGRDDVALFAAVACARLLVPVVAAPAGDLTELGETRSADMAVATITSPDGQRALPVFTSVTALQAWDPAEALDVAGRP